MNVKVDIIHEFSGIDTATIFNLHFLCLDLFHKCNVVFYRKGTCMSLKLFGIYTSGIRPFR
jgi:hypothetical protein